MEISCGPFNVTQRYAKPRVGSDWKKGSRNAIRDSRDMTQTNYGSEIRNITLYVEVKASAASTYEQWVSSIKLKEENIFCSNGSRTMELHVFLYGFLLLHRALHPNCFITFNFERSWTSNSNSCTKTSIKTADFLQKTFGHVQVTLEQSPHCWLWKKSFG